MISDWDDAYDNAGHIGDAEVFPNLWAACVPSFEAERLAAGRADLDCAYGEGPRERLDLFFPDSPPKVFVVFVYGGFDALRQIVLVASCGRAGSPGLVVRRAELSARSRGRIGDITRRSRGRSPTRRAARPGRSPWQAIRRRPSGRTDGLPGRSAAAPERARLVRVAPISGALRPAPADADANEPDARPRRGRGDRREPRPARPLPELNLTAWVGADERPESSARAN